MVNLHLPGVNGAFAIGNHGLKTGQDPPANCKMWIVYCANAHRNRDHEIVTCANPHRNRENEIVTCANAHRNRDHEIVTCANPHRNRASEIVTLTPVLRPSRWDFIHREKPFTSLAIEALPAKQRVGSKCEGTLCTLYLTIFHARYTNIQTNNPYLMGAIGFHCNRKKKIRRQKEYSLVHNCLMNQSERNHSSPQPLNTN